VMTSKGECHCYMIGEGIYSESCVSYGVRTRKGVGQQDGHVDQK
jgi:hypothetical protein